VTQSSNQAAEQGPKKLDDITKADIIEAALVYAVQFRWQVEAGDCRVQALPNRLVIQESGGPTSLVLPTSKWHVHITPRVPPNKFSAHLVVPVEYLSGDVCAMNFLGLHHP
jgi:hypothetical protein